MTAQALPKSASDYQAREPRPVEILGLVKRYGNLTGQAGRAELRPEDAHTAGRCQDSCAGAHRPRHRSRIDVGTEAVGGTDLGDRRSARGKPRRHGATVRGPER